MICPMEYFLYHWPLINLVFYWNLPKKMHHIPLFLCMWQDFLRWRAIVVFTGTPCVETKTLKLMQWKQHNILK